MRRYVLLIPVLALLAIASPSAAQDPPPLADASLSGGGGYVELTEFEDIRDPAPVSGTTGSTTHRQSGPSRPVAVRDLSHDDRSGCPRSPDGYRVVRQYVWADTGEVFATESYCFGFRPEAEPAAPPEPGAPAPPAPPPPPSVEPVADAVAFPATEISLNPDALGATGLEVWLWWEPVDTVTTAVTLAGWTGTVTPRIVALQWNMGNGDIVTATPERTATTTEADPAATYVYQHSCDCQLTVTATWSGTFTLTHPLAPTPYVASLGVQDRPATRAYEVVSIEAVGTG